MYWNHQTSWNHSTYFFLSLILSTYIHIYIPCSKGHSIRAHLDTIQITLLLSTGVEVHGLAHKTLSHWSKKNFQFKKHIRMTSMNFFELTYVHLKVQTVLEWPKITFHYWISPFETCPKQFGCKKHLRWVKNLSILSEFHLLNTIQNNLDGS